MSEEAWYKMLVLSFALHILAISAILWFPKFKPKRLDLSSSYSVNLVGSSGELGGGRREAAPVAAKKAPQKAAPVVKESKPAKVTKAVPVNTKPKPEPIRKNEELLSISKKKVPDKATANEDDLEQVQKKIQNLRKKTDYVDVSKGGGGAKGLASTGAQASGEGSGEFADPLMQKYHMDVLEKLFDVWRVPASSKKGLLTKVLLKIRRDGVVMDVTVEERSGNRLFDESVQRAIRAAEPLPKVPSGLKDPIELGFNFRPEDKT